MAKWPVKTNTQNNIKTRRTPHETQQTVRKKTIFVFFENMIIELCLRPVHIYDDIYIEFTVDNNVG